MIWAYYDESGEYNANGELANLTMGGCVSPFEKWRVLEDEWRAVLQEHTLPAFHMTGFGAWRPPFDFRLPDGSRDKDKHNKILNSLLEIMIRNIEAMHGYAATSILRDGDNAHREYFEDCIVGTVKDAVLETWATYGKSINLVFDRQNHFPEIVVQNYVDFYDFGEAKERISSCKAGKSDESPALQAADILAFEMSKYQRQDRPERYPSKIFRQAARNSHISMTLKWGPLRSRKATFNK
jgi:hypothetical protein